MNRDQYGNRITDDLKPGWLRRDIEAARRRVEKTFPFLSEKEPPQ